METHLAIITQRMPQSLKAFLTHWYYVSPFPTVVFSKKGEKTTN